MDFVRRALVGLSLACLAVAGIGCPHPPPAVNPTPPPVVVPTPPPVVLPPPVVVEPPPTVPACTTVESDLISRAFVVPELQNFVRGEIAKMGDTTGIDCRISLDALAARLRAPGRCVISGQEAVFIQRLDKTWEEYHACYFGTGAMIAHGKFMGGHVRKP